MAKTIRIDVPRAEVGSELSEALAKHGLRAELVESDEVCALDVGFADVQDRLVEDAVHAIEAHLAETGQPFVVQRADGGVVVRPPGD